MVNNIKNTGMSRTYKYKKKAGFYLKFDSKYLNEYNYVKIIHYLRQNIHRSKLYIEEP